MLKIRIFLTITIFFVFLLLFLNSHAQNIQESDSFSSRKRIQNFRMEKKLVERRSFSQSMCHKILENLPANHALRKINAWEFLINEQYHLIWCNIFKAASTSWMYNFNILAGYSADFLKNSRKHLIDWARKKYPRPTVGRLLKKLHTSTSFMIVRHPFERLLAYYEHKLIYSLTSKEPALVYKQLVKKIRTVGEYPTNSRRNRSIPTFKEFIWYVIDLFHHKQIDRTITIDQHWVPMTEFCSPCMINFDYLLQFETIQEEQTYLIEKLNLSHIIKPQWRNKVDSQNWTEMVEQKFKTLTKKDILKLYSFYKNDFLVFNFSLDSYLRYGKDDKQIYLNYF